MQFRKWLVIIVALCACVPLVASAQTGSFGPPLLISPSDRGITRHTPPSFSWRATQGALSYELELSTSANFTTGVQTFAVPNRTSFTPSTNQPDGIYYWRMRAYNGTLYSDWSRQRQFELDTVRPLSPLLLAPASGSTIVGTPPTFSWEPVVDALYYYIYFHNAYGGWFSARVNAPATSFTQEYVPPSPYRWYVAAIDAAGNWSIENPSWEFTQLSAEDAAPEVYFYGLEINSEVPLRWSAIDGATVYHIQVARDPNFSQIVRENSVLTVPEDIHSANRYITVATYYWRVRAGQGNSIWGPWSDTSSFVTTWPNHYTVTPTPTLTPSPTLTPTATPGG